MANQREPVQLDPAAAKAFYFDAYKIEVVGTRSIPCSVCGHQQNPGDSVLFWYLKCGDKIRAANWCYQCFTS